MTSSNGNIFSITGHLWSPRSFDVFFYLRLNKWLSKQSWVWWFETLSHPLWRHRNATKLNMDWYIYFSILTLVSYPWLNFTVVGMEILIQARSRCHKDHHKGKKEEAFSVILLDVPIFQNYCMENDEICLLRLAQSISVIFGLISLCIKRRLYYCYIIMGEWVVVFPLVSSLMLYGKWSQSHYFSRLLLHSLQ